MRRLWAAPLFLIGALLLGQPAHAQDAAPSPTQIQAMIADGQTDQALAALQNVIQAHPKSGVAWYLLAEAYDARNDEANAATALNMAERSAPGLPFANAQEVANLKAHINGAQPHSGNSSHTIMFVIGGVILLVILLRFLPGRGMASRNYGYTAPPPPPGTPPYGFGYGPQTGGGIGSALIGGLAAGAGFAAGERIIDDMTGQRGGGQMFDPNQQTGPDVSRDDGLLGNPGWDGTGTPSDDDLSNTGWS